MTPLMRLVNYRRVSRREFGSRLSGADSCTGAEIAALKYNRFLRVLPDAHLDALLSEAEWAEWPANGFLSQPGEPVEDICFIVSGAAREIIVPPSAHGGGLEAGTLGAGDDVGLLSVVDGAPHSTLVTVVERVRAVALRVKHGHDYLEEHKVCYKVIAAIAMERWHARRAWLQGMASQTPARP